MMKHHCVCPDEDVIVVYDGVKTFWKTRGCLDITIVLHSELLCYEVITYDSFVGLEAPRIYLSSLLVAEKINSTDVETAVAEKKEALIRNKTSFVPEEVAKSIQHEMMIQYILSRLSIPNDLPSGSVAVVLLPFSTDKIDDETKLLDVICEKPSNLIALEIQGRQKNSTSKEINELLHNVKAETTALQYSTHLAELMTSSVDGFQLMLRERIQLKCRVSAVQWRWIKAINKVITQNAVAKIKLRLAEIERAHSKKKIFRMPKKVESKDGNSGHGGIPKSPHYMSGLRNEHSPHSSGHSLTRSCNSSPLSTPLTSPHSSPATTPRSIGDSSISSHRRSQHLSIIAERRKLREVAGETGRRLSRSCASSPVQHLHSQSRPSTPSSPVGNDVVGSPTKKSSSSATLLIKSLTNNGLPAIGDCD